MNIIMAGIDYHCANIEIREKVGFVSSKTKKLLEILKKKSGIPGVVIISTCNRTEVYLSYEHYDNINPVEIFCDAAELNEDEMGKYFYIKKEEEAAIYLFELACGIHSLIFGEDQIISQVKDAIYIAHEVRASDAFLNTLFRFAVTCAKKVKTQIVLNAVSPSVASKVVGVIRGCFVENRRMRALVIGNGVVGRKVCEELLEDECEVFMTLRNHCKKTNILIPKGCKTIDYDDRQSIFSQIDILISATSSPHQTISYDMIINSSPRPKFIFDLAVPRDIEPIVNTIEGINFNNIDTLGEPARNENFKEIAVMKKIIAGYMEKFMKWRKSHDLYCRIRAGRA